MKKENNPFLKIEKITLTVILLISFFLRIYQLEKVPTGFLWDEAALGYNGYSILKTSRDEYGKLLPVVFKSFGDYKPGFYIYLTVLPIAVFGLNQFSVRLPSAIAGGLTVLALFFLVKKSFELFNPQSKKTAGLLALLSSALLAINPWHINFSRGSWELNVMFFELTAAVCFLIYFLSDKKRRYLLFSAIMFVLCLFTYQAAKFLVPVLLFGFILFFRQQIKKINAKEIKLFLLPVITAFVVINLITFFGGKAGRIKIMSVFSYPRSKEEAQIILNQDSGNKIDYTFFHGKYLYHLRSVLERYFNHISAKFLFFDGDWSSPRNFILYHGVFYVIDAVFIFIGIFCLFIKKRNPFENFILFWLIISPLPSALTRDSISSVRSYNMLLPLIYLSSFGLYSFFSYIKKIKIILITCLIFVVSAYLFLFIRFIDLYVVHNPVVNAKGRLYGYKQMVEESKKYTKGKNRIIITTKYGQPYIFYLFYTKYDPAKYHKQANLKEDPYGDVGSVEKIDNIEFRSIYWPVDRGLANSLFIGDEFDLPIVDIVGQKGITFLKEINYPDGKTAFRIVETQ